MNILFVIAMKIEFNYLLTKFSNISEYKLGEYIYYQIELKNKTIYLLHSGIGEISTSISLTKFLNKIKPDIIINAGTSGAHDKKLNVGDIVLATEVINVNSIETMFKEESEESNSLNWQIKTFIEDGVTKNFEGEYKVYYGDKNLISKLKDIGNKEGMTMYEGRVASGDIWNKEKVRIKHLNEKYLTLCEEMEICSVYIICQQENIPCAGIKIISNNEMNGQKYDRNITEKLDEFLYKIILDL
jgi:adenosylhomocysteine nucleosidase